MESGSNTKTRLSVPRVSRLEYVLGILRDHSLKGEVRFDDLYTTVKNIGFQMEKERIRLSGLYRDIMKEEVASKYAKKLRSQTRDVIRLLKRWKILKVKKGEKNVFRIADSSKSHVKDIFDAIRLGDDWKQRMSLYDLALMSGESFILPSKYSVVLRTTGGDIEKQEFAKNLGQAIFGQPINPISIDVVTDWMSFFRFSNTFSIPQPQGRKKDIIVLTKAVASLGEVQNFIAFLKDRPALPAATLLAEYSKYYSINEFAGKSILECARQIGILLQENDKLVIAEESGNEKLLKKALEKNLLAILEYDISAKILKEMPESVKESTFVVSNFSLDFQAFYKVLYQETKRAISTSYGYAWVYDVRREVCKRTHIHSSIFDEYLALIYRKYGPGVLETAAASADTLAAKKIKEVPLNINGTPIHRIRLKREYL